MRIRKDDRVMVMTGKDITAVGRVLRVDPDKGRVLVDGVNRVKRHLRVQPTQRGGQTGGITLKEAWLDASNVQPLCPKCDRPTRVRHRVDEQGEKHRVCARCGEDF